MDTNLSGVGPQAGRARPRHGADELTASQEEVVTPQALRKTMGRFATGVIVLTVGGDHIHGMTANSFGSVSLDPPMVLCCVARSAVMHNAVIAAGSFAVSVLTADQERQARYFAGKDRPLGPAQFDGVDWQPGARTGSPLLAGSLAWLECVLVDVVGAGDHSVFLGRVLSSGLGQNSPGLLFFDGVYRRTTPSRSWARRRRRTGVE